MKALLWSMVYASLAVTVLCISVEHQKLRDRRNKAIEECRKEKPDVSEEDFNVVKRKNEEPKNEIQHCVIDCVYEKFGMLKNGKLDIDEISKAMKIMFGQDETLYSKISDASLFCQKEVEKTYETIGKCQLANVYHSCTIKKMME